MKKLSLSAALVLVSTIPAFAQDSVGEPGRDSDGPNPLNNVYFGEEHLHTTNSPDAFALGARGSWEDAYDWALGKPIKLSTTGETIQARSTLDFVAITDHAAYFGVMPRFLDMDDPLSQSELAKEMRDPSIDPAAPDSPINKILASILTSTAMPEFVTPEILESDWANYVATANKYNKPGEFTAIVAFEWTSIPNGRNMHRNVFWRGDGPQAPFSAFNSYYPNDLWTYQDTYRNIGQDSLAIPHNGNVSDGWMYAPLEFLGAPMSARYAERQARNEPVTEIVQTKGQSDTHPAFSPNDEFAEFEMFPNMINVGQASQIKYGYVRQGLVMGMILEKELGTNPYKYGIVAGSDSHASYTPHEEDNFYGTHSALDDTPAKRLNPNKTPSGDMAARVGSAGLTAVWAPQNTREALFDAIRAKETYGTSGPQIRLRFFGGWDYADGLTSDSNFVQKAYDGGVPMGGDLPDAGGVKAPTFAVWALKDPNSGNLDRIQIIKVFVNKWNREGETIYDVALSDGRTVDPATGKAPAVGNTVDLKTATYTNDIGDTQLSAVWTDPDFDPNQPAAYYVRVLEIPTPRWSTYDSVRNNLPILEDLPATLQERAWSSPIWYTPPK